MPPEETLDEVIERLALNAEMGDVSQLMQEKQAMQNESDPDRLNKALAQIRALKSADYPVMRLVHPQGPVEHKMAWRRWADVPEPAKLSMLQDLVSWEDITNRDMAHILLGELDVGKLSDGQRDMLIRLAEPEPARGKMSLEELKNLANSQRNGHAKRGDRGHER